MPKKARKPIRSKFPVGKADPDLVKEVRRLAETERHLELELAREINLLATEVKKLKHMEVIKIFKHPWKFLGLSMVKGIMVGFGSVLGATVFLTIFVYVLAKISFVPIVGDFVENVIQEIEGSTQVEESQKDSDIFEQYHKAKDDLVEENS